MIKKFILLIFYHFFFHRIFYFVYLFDRNESKRFFVNCLCSKNFNIFILRFESRNKRSFIFFHQSFFQRRQSFFNFIDFFPNDFSKFQERHFFNEIFFRNIKNIESEFDNFLFKRIDFLNDFLLEIKIIVNCF